ncbi:MAG: nucleotidyltransferase family protein [Chloroflexota bacterium]
MKALILAAGYATRLGALTKDRPKPLLPIAGKPMIDHLLAQLDAITAIDAAYVVTNARFADQFALWAGARQGRLPVTVLNDGTTTDQNKLGAIGDIQFTLQQAGITDDLFVGAGDNLFDFDLGPMFAFFAKHGSTIGLYDVGRLDLMPDYSEVRLDGDRRITHFVEKPPQPTSTFMATALYLYQASHLPLLARYLAEGGNADSPGRFPAWLHRQVPVYGYVFQGRWFDIGTPAQYQQADDVWTRERPA